MSVIRRNYSFETKEQLDNILAGLLDIQTGKVFSIEIKPGIVRAELSGEILINYATDDLLKQISSKEVKPFNYDGEFSIDVLFAMMNVLKKDGLFPSYFVINPGALIKEEPHWECALIEGLAEKRFMGLVVVEDDRLDESSFVLVGCSGQDPRIYTIERSLKGDIS